MILRNEVALLKPQAPKIEGGLGIFGFAVLAIFWIGFSVLVFIAVCAFSVLAFGFRFSRKILTGFRI